MKRAREAAAPLRIAKALERRLRSEGDPERAIAMKAYMKSDLEFFGVSSAQVRRAGADIARAHPDLDRAMLLEIVRALYATASFDLRSVAIVLLDQKSVLLAPGDLPFLIELVKTSSCWAHVDWLSTKVFPKPLERLDPKARAARIRAWARDDHLWVRRTALLVQHDALKKGGGDFELFAQIALPMLEEEVFWIRKAIGWVLREVSKKRPQLVRAFVRAHGARMSGLTRREAEKYL